MSGGQEAKRRGNLGEAAVIAYLRERGWNMVEVNFRSKYGEIDLIAEDGRYLAFVEVKLRSTICNGTPHGSSPASTWRRSMPRRTPFLRKLHI